MLLKVKNAKVLSLPYLNIFVLRYIYERGSMTITEIDLMMHSIITWAKKTDLSYDDRVLLEYIGSLLEKEEKGKFAQRKESFKQHGISWVKFHRIPNGVLDYVRATQAAGRFN